jgi:alpha-beta hydrolase superfamily lysophospholipase
MKNWKRRLIILLSTLAAVYLAACGYLWSTQTQAIFDPCGDVFQEPKSMGMHCEKVRVPVTSDGEQIMLDGIWIPAATGDPTKAPSILHLHGQDDTVGKNLEHSFRQLNALGYNVFQVDYRGYGASFDTYTPSEKTVCEDAEAAWQFLITDRGADPSRTFIYGHSLGGAVAIELAIHHPDDAAGLIVESPFTSINYVSHERHPILTRLLPMNLLIRHPFNSKGKIGNLQMPVLLIHGKEDVKIKPWMTEELYELAPEPKELLMIAGGEHTNCASVGSVDYKAKVSAFVERCIESAATK